MNGNSKIFGIRAIIEALNSGQHIDKVFIQQSSESALMSELRQLLAKYNIPINYVPVEKLNRLSKGNHQGAVALVSPVSFVTIEEMIENSQNETTPALFVVLDQLSDVRNFGAILRTAECTGVSGIIIQKHGNAPINADTVKTSAGAVFNIPVAKVDHIKDAIYYLQGSGITTLAATEKAEQLIYELDLKGPLAIIMGSEGKGINPSVLKITDQMAKLPILGQIESLNVSVACGAFLYEVVRQRL